MSDFGANIFDDEQDPRPVARPRSESSPEPKPEPRAATPAPAAPEPTPQAAPAGRRSRRAPRRAPAEREPVEREQVEREQVEGQSAERVAVDERRSTAPQARREEPREPAAAPRSHDEATTEQDRAEAEPARHPRHHRHERYERPQSPHDDRRFPVPDERAREADGPRHGERRAEREVPGRRPPNDDARRPHDERGRGPRPGSQRAPSGRESRPTAAPALASITLLIDLDALHAEARAQRAELALNRLRTGLAAERPVVRAVAFTASACTPPHGFECIPTAADAAVGGRLSALAFELAQEHTIVLAPASPAMRQVAQSLLDAGHAVELASFAANAVQGREVRRLGRDCLFVP